MNSQIYRAWINQPSTEQALHLLHGRYCIVHDCGGPVVRLYFTEGDVHSMDAPRWSITRVPLSNTQN